MSKEKEFLNHQEASDLLNFKPTTLYNYVVKGKIQTYKAKGRLHNLYKRSELVEMILPVKKKENEWK
jgi:hypothetical protein